jgi:hypothetical protein
MSIAKIQKLMLLMGFAIARAGHAERRGDEAARLEAEAEITRLRPLLSRPAIAEEIAEAEADAVEVRKRLQGRVPILTIPVEERKFVHPVKRTRVFRATLGKPARRVRRRT